MQPTQIGRSLKRLRERLGEEEEKRAAFKTRQTELSRKRFRLAKRHEVEAEELRARQEQEFEALEESLKVEKAALCAEDEKWQAQIPATEKDIQDHEMAQGIYIGTRLPNDLQRKLSSLLSDDEKFAMRWFGRGFRVAYYEQENGRFRNHVKPGLYLAEDGQKFEVRPWTYTSNYFRPDHSFNSIRALELASTLNRTFKRVAVLDLSKSPHDFIEEPIRLTTKQMMAISERFPSLEVLRLGTICTVALPGLRILQIVLTKAEDVISPTEARFPQLSELTICVQSTNLDLTLLPAHSKIRGLVMVFKGGDVLCSSNPDKILGKERYPALKYVDIVGYGHLDDPETDEIRETMRVLCECRGCGWDDSFYDYNDNSEEEESENEYIFDPNF